MSYAKKLYLYHDMSDDEIDSVSKQIGLYCVLAKNNANYNSQVGREFDGSGIQM